MPLSPTARIVAVAFAVSGTTHLVRPRAFKPLMPRWVPAHRQVIAVSGIAELLCAAGLAYPPTRRVAAYASAGLLVGVFPGNVTMARKAARRGGPAYRAVAFARLPLQLPMIVSMVKTARRAR